MIKSPTQPLPICGAKTRNGSVCRNAPLTGKTRCKLHGGMSDGPGQISPEGRQRINEGRVRWLAKMRAEGRKPGPSKGECPPKIDPVEKLRTDTLDAVKEMGSSEKRALDDFASLFGDTNATQEPPPSPAPSNEQIEATFAALFGREPPSQQPAKPQVVSRNDNPQPLPLADIGRSCVVHETSDIANGRTDASELAGAVERVARQAIVRIEEILRHPLDRSDPNFAALLRFLASTYNTSMGTLVRVDENKLRKQQIDRLPQILKRVEEERRLQDQRIIEGAFTEVEPDGAA
jgi:hypothetical protein